MNTALAPGITAWEAGDTVPVPDSTDPVTTGLGTNANTAEQAPATLGMVYTVVSALKLPPVQVLLAARVARCPAPGVSVITAVLPTATDCDAGVATPLPEATDAVTATGPMKAKFTEQLAATEAMV